MQEKEKEPAVPKEVLDPNDPSSYHLPPPELQSEEFAFRGGSGRKGRAGGEDVLPPGDEETVLTEKMAGEERKKAELEGDEEERAPASKLPQMKPMPSKSGEKLMGIFPLKTVLEGQSTQRSQSTQYRHFLSDTAPPWTGCSEIPVRSTLDRRPFFVLNHLLGS